MHLRGPMNVSQLAVYQVPSEAFKMRKRNTVPFYNRRRALKQRVINEAMPYRSKNLDHRMWTTIANHKPVPSVTSNVFITGCGRSDRGDTGDASMTLPNITDTDSPLPCLSTPYARSTTTGAAKMSSVNSIRPNNTCSSPATVTKDLERHPRPIVMPTSTNTSTVATDKAELRKRAAAWDRIAYYSSAAPAQATGFSFLANLGDPRKSGTFD